MIKKINKAFSIIVDFDACKQAINLIYKNGFLYELGWIQSYRKKQPLDKDGQPLPWVTYSFIEFIRERLNSTQDIFEFGSGNSTFFYAERANLIDSVEHDKDWFDKIKNNYSQKVNLIFKDMVPNGEYSKAASTTNRKYDIIIVDGRDRVNCTINSINYLKDSGILVLDDSEREIYKKGVEFMIQNGFKKIDFWGLAPGVFNIKSTTVFYRANNCLGI